MEIRKKITFGFVIFFQVPSLFYEHHEVGFSPLIQFNVSSGMDMVVITGSPSTILKSEKS